MEAWCETRGVRPWLFCVIVLIVGFIITVLTVKESSARVKKYVDAEGIIHYYDTNLIPSKKIEVPEDIKEFEVGIKKRKKIRKKNTTPIPTEGKYIEYIKEIAQQHKINPSLLWAIAKSESNFNPNAVSPKQAVGITQLMPKTSKRFNVADPYDPYQNIEGGAKYLKYLLELFKRNITLVIAGYNAGEGAVQKHGGVPPYQETRNFIDRVFKNLKKAEAEKLFENKVEETTLTREIDFSEPEVRPVLTTPKTSVPQKSTPSSKPKRRIYLIYRDGIAVYTATPTQDSSKIDRKSVV